MQSKHKQTICKHSRRNSYRITAFSVGITILNQRIIYKDDIEFVTEFPCLLGHPVHSKECIDAEFLLDTCTVQLHLSVQVCLGHSL